MQGSKTFEVKLGPGGQNSFQLLRVKVAGESTGVQVNYDSAMILDPLGAIEDLSVLQDLPAPTTSNLTDKYQIWEYKTAFKQTIFKAYELAVDRAEIKEGD